MRASTKLILDSISATSSNALSSAPSMYPMKSMLGMSPLLPPSSDTLTTGMPADFTTLTRSGLVYWDAIAMSGCNATTSSGSNPMTGTFVSSSATFETSGSTKNE